MRWFTKSFWRAFKSLDFPIEIPATVKSRQELVLKVYENIKSSRYAPGIPEKILVENKGSGVVRIIPVFSMIDYCVYYYCIKELESVLSVNRTPNTFGGWSLGGQIRKEETSEVENEITGYGRYSFDPRAWNKAFGEFNSLIFSQLNTGVYSHVLQFDLSNFYDSIRLDMLERWIREESAPDKSEVISLLFYFLNHWNRENTGLHPQVVGLPQDALADCSRLLANFYLQKYDKYAQEVCSNAGAVYFRYSDDQMILLNSTGDVEGILLLLTKNLDRFNLRVNQMKVRLWIASELNENRCRSIQSIFVTSADYGDPVLVEKFVDLYLSKSLNSLHRSWNHGTPLLNRLIFANLESLPQSKFELVVKRLVSKSYLETCSERQMIRAEILNKKLSRPLNFDRRLKVISDRSVHNAYHYRVLNYAQKTRNKFLEKAILIRIESLESQMKSQQIY